MKILFFILFFASSLHAKTIQVDYLARQFRLEVTPQEISFQARDMQLSLIKKKCSQGIFERFLKEFNRSLALPNDETGETIVLLVDKLKLRERVDSRKGAFFISLPEEMKRMKIEEGLRCR